MIDVKVVKFGAYIVDALSHYRQPVIVYLPPWSELRGGSWVVIGIAPIVQFKLVRWYINLDWIG